MWWQKDGKEWKVDLHDVVSTVDVETGFDETHSEEFGGLCG